MLQHTQRSGSNSDGSHRRSDPSIGVRFGFTSSADLFILCMGYFTMGYFASRVVVREKLQLSLDL